MQITHEVVIDCSHMTPANCSDVCLEALSHGAGFKLKADSSTDTIHGSVTIQHSMPPNPHLIIVEVYEEDRGRQRKPAKMPTASQVTGALDKLKIRG